MKALKDFVRARPALYDQMRRLKRGLTGTSDLSFRVLDEFSRKYGRKVNFIQVGANDGLRNDPLRPLIVRDDWQGVLIEPLPSVFPMLRENYAYLKNAGLKFVNAAIMVQGEESLSFWGFSTQFLQGLAVEERLDYLRKASFDRKHVASFLPPDADPDEVLVEVPVPCLGLAEIVAEHLPRRPLHLLAIDVEGYEGVLIPSIDFTVVRPEAVFFESEHLGENRARVWDHLQGHGYTIEKVGLDSMAFLKGGVSASQDYS